MSVTGHAYCIVCAKQDELVEARKVITHAFPETHVSWSAREPIHLISQPPRGAPARTLVATCCARMGHVHAASLTARLIASYSPTLIFFVGTAASLNPEKIRLGDVVIPQNAAYRFYDKIVEKGEAAYDEAISRYGDSEKFFDNNVLVPDQDAVKLSNGAQNVLSNFNPVQPLEDQELDKKWLDMVKGRKPQLERDVDIVTCGMVVNSQSYKAHLAKNSGRKAYAIDMESYGFFQALADDGGPTVGIMIRGISDYAGRKETTEQISAPWKSLAARNAATVACDIIRQHDQDFQFKR